MRSPFSRLLKPAALALSLLSLMACGATTTVVIGGGTSTASVAAATATHAPPTATPTLAPGICKAAGFPTTTDGGPEGLTYPPLSYYYDLTPGAGNHPYAICSSGNPASILAFMKQSVVAGGWTLTASTSTTLTAQRPTTPPSGSCYTVNMTVGANASYPGEWSANFHPPIVSCV